MKIYEISDEKTGRLISRNNFSILVVYFLALLNRK